MGCFFRVTLPKNTACVSLFIVSHVEALKERRAPNYNLIRKGGCTGERCKLKQLALSENQLVGCKSSGIFYLQVASEVHLGNIVRNKSIL